MFAELEKLLVLQERDLRLRALKTELKNAPLERKELEARLAAAAKGADAAKARQRELEVEKKRLEVEAQGKRDQIAKFKTQQMQTRKNEEFQAFTQQIGHFEQDIQRIEDHELELMEALETHRPVLAQAEKAAAEAKSQVAAQLADLEAKTAAVQGQLAEVEAVRAGLAAGVDPDALYQYDRLAATKGGNVVVPLEHETCGGCHMKLTTQTAFSVRAGRGIVNCEQCGRMLYEGA